MTKIEPSALPDAKRAELLEFARAIEAHTVQLEHARCEPCGCHYDTGWGGYPSCPRCNEQPLSLDDQLGVLQCWPGHDFVWNPRRGPRGRWQPAQDSTGSSSATLRSSSRGRQMVCQAMALPVGIVHELTRLQRIVTEADLPNIERAEREAKRASQLADRCGDLTTALERKRVECDELRDALGSSERLRLTDGGRRGVAEMRRRHG